MLTQQPLTNDKQLTSFSEVLIRVEKVSKKFCRSLKRSLWYGMKDIAAELSPFSPNLFSERTLNTESSTNNQRATNCTTLRQDEFWAVRDVSFELCRGECLGLIGHNGAGKTTLLKMLNGLIKPDSGRIEMRGRVRALIALGAGFNPILTGRENIYINASILGLSKREIDDKLDEIVDFAEIDDFIDSPVQSYSSGMQVRLGFAVATALKPDVLILDEVLAVGDPAFRAKCTNKIRSIKSNCAMIFVSHNLSQVREICERGLHLSRGLQVTCSTAQEAIESFVKEQSNQTSKSTEAVRILNEPILAFMMKTPREVRFGDDLLVDIQLEAVRAPLRLYVRLVLWNDAGRMVWEANGKFSEDRILMDSKSVRFETSFGRIFLNPGVYKVDFFLIEADTELLLVRSHLVETIIVSGKSFGFGDSLSECVQSAIVD